MKVKWSDPVAATVPAEDFDVEAAKRRRLLKAKLSEASVQPTGASTDSGESTREEKTPSVVDFHLMAKRLGRNFTEKNHTPSKKASTPADRRGKALQAYRTGVSQQLTAPRGQKLDKVG